MFHYSTEKYIKKVLTFQNKSNILTGFGDKMSTHGKQNNEIQKNQKTVGG